MKPPRKITGMAVMIGAIFALFTSGKDAFGQLDPTFHPPYFAVPDFASRVLLLPDGKYVVYFNVETLRDQPTGAIARYFADGTLDTSFGAIMAKRGGLSCRCGSVDTRLCSNCCAKCSIERAGASPSRLSVVCKTGNKV